MGRLGGGKNLISVDKLYQMFCIDKDAYYARYEQQVTLSADFKSLIDAMLNPDPLLRPSTADILMHPWI